MWEGAAGTGSGHNSTFKLHVCVCVYVCVCVCRQTRHTKSKRLCSGGVCSYSSPVTKASCLTQLKWQFTVTTVVADKTPRLTKT